MVYVMTDSVVRYKLEGSGNFFRTSLLIPKARHCSFLNRLAAMECDTGDWPLDQYIFISPD